MIALLLVVFAADATVPRTPPPALTRDAALQAQHDGYIRYLIAHPELAAVEGAWWSRMRDAGYHYAERAFDESLLGDVAAETRFDRYYDRLYADADAKQIAESLARIEFSPGDLAPLFSEAMRDLRADPGAALAQLQADPESEIPDALAPMLGYLSENPSVLNELVNGLQGITGSPVNLAEIAPWWAQSAQTTGGTGAAYAGLTTAFVQEPEAFWDWHRRNLALAADAQARDWIRYWHRQVRRTPGLANTYYAWLATRADPARAPKRVSPEALDWPPKTAPPELAPLPTTLPQPNAATSARPGSRLSVPRAARPTVARPTRPSATSQRSTSSVARPTPPTPPARPSARK